MEQPKEALPYSVHEEVAKTEKRDSSAIQAEAAAYEERKVDLRTILAIVALAVTYESVILSFVLPAAVLLTINADIGPSTQLNWAPTAWTLAQGVVMTIAGSLSDICGRRNFTLAGNTMGLIGTTLESFINARSAADSRQAALLDRGLSIVNLKSIQRSQINRARSINTVIIGLAFTGFGSGSQLLSLPCANEIVPKKSRGKAIAALNMASMPGSCFGSLIAYRLVATLNWRWTFYVGIIANGLALVLVAIFYWPPDFIGLHPEGKSRRQQFQELDFAGLLLFGGGLTIFLLGISWGNNPYAWTSVHVLVPLFLGISTFLVAFPVWELYGPRSISKLCPPEIFTNFRTFILPLIVSFVSGSLLVTFQVFWPQQVQLLFTTKPQQIGWYSVAYNTPVTVIGALAAFSFTTFGYTRIQFSSVTFFQAISTAAMASVTQHTPTRAIVLVVFAAGFVGATHMLKILMLQFGASDKHIGLATGLMGSTTAIGGAIALAIYSSIIRDTTASDLAPSVAAAVTKAGLPLAEVQNFLPAFLSHNSTALEAVTGVTPIILAAADEASKDVYSQAFKLVYLVTIAFGGESTRLSAI
ncbi:hypothetical protein PV08_07296 [Exophiala spinifera]|uniref:Major facilitator superfamily (MFS) profile domain-containing protein n=1 Tax=Exophiala spinifera TaxID=91928 RepID=A0A0D1ZP17_9EURO|nr:uncharacterized protein PV08_07296 [Exophiala spinifera]KIW14512.1 hypothetical protein PV08_07296 [Exophiala spinifera]